MGLTGHRYPDDAEIPAIMCALISHNIEGLPVLVFTSQ